MADQLALLDRIRELLQSDASDPSGSLLAEMEHTLTDGYARALGLEGERWRLRKRIGELAQDVRGGEEANELRTLSDRLRSAELDLTRLRSHLEILSRRLDHARAAVSETSSS